MTADVADFVARVRARRAVDGMPEHLDSESVYRLLDGLLARDRREVPDDAA